jgi:hypothetical protein
MAEVAQQKLDHIVARSNEKYTESLKVDGVKAFLWTKDRKGAYCSCTNKRNFTSLRETGPNEDLKSTESSEGLSSIKLKPMRVEMRSRFRDVPSTDMEKIVDLEKTALGKNYDKDEDLEIYSDSEFFNQEDVDDGIVDNSDSEALTGGEQTLCAICFGTGYVNGYDLHGGQRIILDTTVNHILSGGVYVDSDANPSSFVVEKNKNVVFETVLPSYFTTFLRLRVMNNDSIVDPTKYTLQYKPINEQTYQNFDIETLSERIGLNNNFNIKIAFLKDSTFTHIELIFKCNDDLHIQMPNVSVSESLDHFEPLLTTNFELPANVPMMRSALISESKYGKIWKISDFTKSQTTLGQVFALEASGRMLHRFETVNLLNLFNSSRESLYRGPDVIQNGY